MINFWVMYHKRSNSEIIYENKSKWKKIYWNRPFLQKRANVTTFLGEIPKKHFHMEALFLNWDKNAFMLKHFTKNTLKSTSTWTLFWKNVPTWRNFCLNQEKVLSRRSTFLKIFLKISPRRHVFIKYLFQ